MLFKSLEMNSKIRLSKITLVNGDYIIVLIIFYFFLLVTYYSAACFLRLHFSYLKMYCIVESYDSESEHQHEKQAFAEDDLLEKFAAMYDFICV